MSRRLPIALRAAWLAFRMALLGWDVSGYSLKVWPGFGREAGSIWLRQPVSPRSSYYPESEGEPGWGVSICGDTYRQTWPTPMDAARSEWAVAAGRKREDIRAGRG